MKENLEGKFHREQSLPEKRRFEDIKEFGIEPGDVVVTKDARMRIDSVVYSPERSGGGYFEGSEKRTDGRKRVVVESFGSFVKEQDQIIEIEKFSPKSDDPETPDQLLRERDQAKEEIGRAHV